MGGRLDKFGWSGVSLSSLCIGDVVAVTLFGDEMMVVVEGGVNGGCVEMVFVESRFDCGREVMVEGLNEGCEFDVDADEVGMKARQWDVIANRKRMEGDDVVTGYIFKELVVVMYNLTFRV